MYKFIAYIPKDDLETVKTALFKAGAGRLGAYDCCSWQVLGLGQFRPLKGATPAIGEVGQLEFVEEWRVEMVVPKTKINDVLKAYRTAHPYEMPAYDIFEMVNI